MAGASVFKSMRTEWWRMTHAVRQEPNRAASSDPAVAFPAE